jgi:uncharacterized protein YndB with AHSA1/START domain/TfoX/Sxy family transcriptional regulator of competence genes
MAEYAASIEIDAAPGDVFDYLVTDAGMTAWMGQYASLDPRPGGNFAVDIAGYAVRGRYLHVERPHRVVFSWGHAGSTDLPPGASTVEFTLTATAHGTRVDLVHTGLPDILLDGHRDGWTHFLPRLRTAAAGGDAGPDDWVPGPGHAPDTVSRVRAALAAHPTREVSMFGGRSFMVNDKIVVAVRGDGDLLVRIDPGRHRELIARPGAQPARMGAGRTMGPSWLCVAESAVATDEHLSYWIDAALEYNARAGRAAR